MNVLPSSPMKKPSLISMDEVYTWSGGCAA
jgi:hypothetical protein